MDLIKLETLTAKATFLGAVLNMESDAWTIIMPVTKSQQKEGINGDFLCLPFQTPLTERIRQAYEFLVEWEEKWSLRNEIKKKEIESYIREKLKTDDVWAKRALIILYNKQTLSEQNSEHTIENNSVGFTGVDGGYLSSLAKQLIRHLESVKRLETNITEKEALRRAWLSPKQLTVLKKTVQKYWKQVYDSSDEVKLLKMIKSDRNAQQMSMTLD